MEVRSPLKHQFLLGDGGTGEEAFNNSRRLEIKAVDPITPSSLGDPGASLSAFLLGCGCESTHDFQFTF